MNIAKTKNTTSHSYSHCVPGEPHDSSYMYLCTHTCTFVHTKLAVATHSIELISQLKLHCKNEIKFVGKLCNDRGDMNSSTLWVSVYHSP